LRQRDAPLFDPFQDRRNEFPRDLRVVAEDDRQRFDPRVRPGDVREGGELSAPAGLDPPTRQPFDAFRQRAKDHPIPSPRPNLPPPPPPPHTPPPAPPPAPTTPPPPGATPPPSAAHSFSRPPSMSPQPPSAPPPSPRRTVTIPPPLATRSSRHASAGSSSG